MLPDQNAYYCRMSLISCPSNWTARNCCYGTLCRNWIYTKTAELKKLNSFAKIKDELKSAYPRSWCEEEITLSSESRSFQNATTDDPPRVLLLDICLKIKKITNLLKYLQALLYHTAKFQWQKNYCHGQIPHYWLYWESMRSKRITCHTP